MAKLSISTLKGFFQPGDKPSQSEFSSLIESTSHTEVSPATSVSGTSTAIPAIDLPANHLITNLFIVFTQDTGTFTSATVGAKVGISSGGVQVVAADSDAITGAVTSLNKGKGTASTNALKTGLGGNATLDIVAESAYSAAEREIHFTITSTHSTFSGNVICGVQYVILN
tara:strand:- start:177 stop:686 length:510 start_codon:yes stop_codon:yes gene_type:complete